MIAVLSPAKNLDLSPYGLSLKPTLPAFKEESAKLMIALKALKSKQIGTLMGLSEKLAELNFERYQRWDQSLLKKDGKPALFTFNGDVYRGLNVASYTEENVAYAQEHLVMLSGLHGLLKPLDRILPYRLEMGSKLKVDRSTPDLYAFWRAKIGAYLEELAERQKTPLIVNLASNEYAKAMLAHPFRVKIIHCHFLDWKNGRFQAIQTWTKLARGAMASAIVKGRIDSEEGLREVTFDGYSFDKKQGSDKEFVFTRKKAR